MAESGVAGTRQLLISETAARRIQKVATGGGADAFLRVGVSGGGCSGFQYNFELSTERQADDHEFQRDGAKVVIDDTSLDLLAGAELDFVEDLSGAQFQMRNPNASSSCGCGMSFSI
ncbi:MAG TPA: iron-sulfur cluster assembly accessory protein [Aliidongia sp.]|uniref:HesB/IscA family protein n=1 Tax=Aliidongia sp. TaxID=1914230 RepID=UPI002DDCAE7A|nr:iron-sulfur cluster assembly accessory protein [Aliidongia sp.]HEV2678118.1 iron-sulfur cluster assembly accessory protein [Aliidongia sp.]